MKNALVFVAIATLFPYCIFAQKTAINATEKQQLLQNLTRLISQYYVYPDKGAEISQYLNKQYERAKYDSVASPNEFVRKLSDDIRFICKDKHLRLDYNPELESDILKFNASGKNTSKITQADFNKEKQQNFYFRKIQILPSNIGYIEFTNFAQPGEEARKTLNAAMQFIINTDALIIDLRNNYGGNGAMVAEMLGYFFDSRTYTGRSFNRIENKWTDSYVEKKNKKTRSLIFNKPVYLLTSNGTFSAAEGFAYALKHLKNAFVIGENTRGGAHLTRSFSVGNGFVAFIPYSRFENTITKIDWEGIGVVPDIAVSAENSLITAQQHILSKKLIAADEKEKKKITWQLRYYKSKTSTIVIDATVSNKYTGRFAEFEVVFENKELKIRDTNQSGMNFKSLIPITETFFQAGDDYQIEFLGDKNKDCTIIRMYWDDGWIEEIQRQH